MAIASELIRSTGRYGSHVKVDDRAAEDVGDVLKQAAAFETPFAAFELRQVGPRCRPDRRPCRA
jgi:hypothetical protein